MTIFNAAARWRPGLLLGAAAAFAASSALAEDRPPIMVRAEQCLVRKVDRVVAVEPDVQSAADFLVHFACADEVSGAARYERNTLYVKMMGSMFSHVPAIPRAAGAKPPAMDMTVNATVDPETGEVIMPKPVAGAAWNPIQAMLPQMDGAMGQMTSETVPVSLRKLAGELVLAAREKQLAKGR